eukprot:jgi/Antlo1/1556/916
MLLCYLCIFRCLIVETSRSRPYRELRELEKDTAMLVDYKYVDLDTRGDSDTDDYHAVNMYNYKCRLRIKSHKDPQDVEKHGRIVTNYLLKKQEESFLFIADRSEYYLFSVYDEHERGDKALQVTIYEGRKNDPRIMSSADSHAKDIHRKIQAAIDYCKSISNIQRFDIAEDAEFKSYYEMMGKIVFYSVVFKVVAVVSTFFFFNKKIKEFYLSKKIISE